MDSRQIRIFLKTQSQGVFKIKACPFCGSKIRKTDQDIEDLCVWIEGLTTEQFAMYYKELIGLSGPYHGLLSGRFEAPYIKNRMTDYHIENMSDEDLPTLLGIDDYLDKRIGRRLNSDPTL